MLLFTTPAPGSTNAQPPARSTTGGGSVVDAIRQGAAQSGTSFDYLLTTAKKESALDPTAKAPTSSASGLFQFIEQTWLGLVKSEGAGAGLGDYASAITSRSDGVLTVSNPDTKQAILKLREDPQLASTLAGTLTQKNRSSLMSETGRDPSPGDLYAAHVLGAHGAAELINAASATPTRTAALDFPEAAAANRGLFYDRGGRARSAADVYAALTASYAGQTDATAPSTASSSPVGGSGQTQPSPALYGLFQTESRAGPVSDAVARVWRTNNTAKVVTPAVSFFPHETTAASADVQATSSTGAIPAPLQTASVQTASAELPDIAPVTVPATSSLSAPPLPPSRPRFATDGVFTSVAAGAVRTTSSLGSRAP